jgi:hypothetical protein
MVGVTIQCRVGNQLFQYAFIKSLAEQLDTPFFLNDNFEKFIAADYFDFEGYHPLKNLLNRFIFKIKHAGLFRSSQSIHIDNSEILRNPGNDLIYHGYFQSKEYFQHIDHKISSYIQIKKTYRKLFEAKYGYIFSKTPVIAVHVRRGDYLHLNDWWAQNLGDKDLTLPVSYYAHCLNQIENLQRYQIIFVSDDIEFTQKQFAGIENAKFQKNDMIIDFQIIMNADICVVSNSSFSWWAAYLNTKRNKQVYCPQFWLGFKIGNEYPQNIIPNSWKQVAI